MLTPDQKALLAELESEAEHLTKKAEQQERRKQYLNAAQFYKEALYRVRNVASLPLAKTQAKLYERRVNRVIELHNQMILRARERREARHMVLGIVTREPGVLQTELYNRMPQQPRELVRDIIAGALEEGRVSRTRTGRTYALYPLTSGRAGS